MELRTLANARSEIQDERGRKRWDAICPHFIFFA